MTFLFLAIIGFLLGLLGITLYNVWTAPQLANAPRLQSAPAVSILIPARNEQANLGACLDALRAQAWPVLEILVLDDDSTDATAAVVQEVAAQDARVRLIRSAPLPKGWLGKNWACQQLSEQAAGEILLFVDADTRCGTQAVSHTIAWMDALRAGMLSSFPYQITTTLSEKLVVPVIYMFVYSFLPVRLVYRSRLDIFAAANGQWIAFTRQTYERIGGHSAVRDQIVEDVELCRLAKRKGERVILTCGNRDVWCRMYDSYKSVWEGFSKNAFGLVGFRSSVLFGLMLVCVLAFILPYAGIFIEPVMLLSAVAVFLNIALRFILSVKFDQPVAGVFLHPVAVALTILIGLNSYRWFKAGKVKWKGRRMEDGEWRRDEI